MERYNRIGGFAGMEDKIKFAGMEDKIKAS